ncbi:hypothetical protein B1A87_006975 [Arthrobacter sp. KBS0703]|uniref:variant leucine-rich repeat-containing protein n=1 Tax=Arthrobacter sp. KBS0703 TaxID=1955698 RepID=UPI001116EE10|nr:hypothetical protein [Arthrobacter sp. KBS0703]TSE15681.1 hypothetical protein B1A87_006975 [Arthrobacter sp. KBS0703]
MKVEFDYGGRTFLVDSRIPNWDLISIKVTTVGKVSLEKDLHTGDDIYVNWDQVGVLRRVSERTEKPRPVATTPPLSAALQPVASEPPKVAVHATPHTAGELAMQSSRSNKDVEALSTEASNPNTTPARLSQLAHMVPATRVLVARNPASPPSLLAWLKELNDPAIDEALLDDWSSP